MRIPRTLRLVALALVGAAALAPTPAPAQWSTTYEQFYLPGDWNWQFRQNYPGADRLFNGFDFGHAILYETLWTRPSAPASELEERWYDKLTQRILPNPPRLPLEEAAIEIAYARLAPEAKVMFDWAHLLHRQIYDVWADERLPLPDKDAKVAELLRYYRSRPDLAFSARPKTMELMEGQPYSTAFRKRYPKFNGLIWAYHWLQVGLYEPLVTGRDKAERQTGVMATVARFWQMIEDPPTNMPRVMPMTAAIAPVFAARYPEAAIIFDNLHSMHDVVSDILANPSVPRDRKRAEILLAARRYRDDTSFVMTVAEWRDMTQMMGIQNMGGPAVGFLPDFPTPTVERGAVMAGMDHSRMHAPATPAPPADTAGRDTTAAHHHAPAEARRDSADATSPHARQMMEMHMRMLADSVIRRRILADTAMRRMLREMTDSVPAEHRGHLEELLRDTVAAPPASTPAARPAARTPARATAKPPAKPAPKPAAKPKPVDPHAGHRPPA